ncbi:MAG: selenide, water dikinase SelD, partial [Dehalococcoidia bacterium]
MGPEALAQVLSPLVDRFDPSAHPDLLVGLGKADDAAVLRVNARTAVVVTCDFFAPVVDDPYDYGAIAAANAMSDVYAMGGEVALALHIAAFPEDLPAETIQLILKGSADSVAEAGGVVAGGHTVWDSEPKFGLSVLGLARPSRLMTKSALRPGDVLFLSKPLGTGTILTAEKAGEGRAEWTEDAIAWMRRLNRHAMHLAAEAGCRAATDVTGFGLVGHLWEMAERSGLGIEIEADSLPLLAGARECAAAGFRTGGEGRNRDWVGDHLALGPAAAPEVEPLLFDPQTSGGLVTGIPARRAAAFAERAKEDGL